MCPFRTASSAGSGDAMWAAAELLRDIWSADSEARLTEQGRERAQHEGVQPERARGVAKWGAVVTVIAAAYPTSKYAELGEEELLGLIKVASFGGHGG